MRILAQGEGAVLVELGESIDDAVNARVHALARAVRERLPDAGLEVVPSYRSLLVLHDPVRTPRVGLVRTLRTLAARLGRIPAEAPRRVLELPVCYGGELGPDLDEVARLIGRTPQAVVALHTAPVYRVHLLGFTPGFPYLGGLDPALERTAPRGATRPHPARERGHRRRPDRRLPGREPGRLAAAGPDAGPALRPAPAPPLPPRAGRRPPLRGHRSRGLRRGPRRAAAADRARRRRRRDRAGEGRPA